MQARLCHPGKLAQRAGPLEGSQRPGSWGQETKLTQLGTCADPRVTESCARTDPRVTESKSESRSVLHTRCLAAGHGK